MKHLAILVPLVAACSAKTTAPAATQSPVERGAYLVTVAGCNDCHTPLKMGPNGPERDATRLLSGHPAPLAMPPAPAGQGPWAFTAAGTMTAWSGPWGVSFTANLTPDKATGIGTWTADNFIATLRNGRHMGAGRPLLPPMPSESFARMTDEDLRAMFAYLQSIPAVSNKVPEPVAPPTAMLEGGK